MFRLIKDCVPACHDLTGLSERAPSRIYVYIDAVIAKASPRQPSALRIGPNRRLYSVTVTGRLKYPTHISGLSLAFPRKPRSSLLIFTPGRARLELSHWNPIAAFLSPKSKEAKCLENLNERQLQSCQGRLRLASCSDSSLLGDAAAENTRAAAASSFFFFFVDAALPP